MFKKIYYTPPPSFEIINVDCLRKQNHRKLLYNHNHIHNLDSQEKVSEDYKNKTKIVIYTPELDVSCGGIIVLHFLAYTLQSLVDENIEILLYSYNYKKYQNSFCNKFFNPNLIDDKTIVIYPESISGNPLNAKHIIRWILLELGIDTPKKQVKTWNPKDLVYHWEPNNHPDSKQLINLWIDPDIRLFNDLESRNFNCYAYKKVNYCEPGKFHKNINTYHNKELDICIDNYYNSNNTQIIVGIFNNCKKFYCYDPNTFYAVMAPLCGCVTVLHPIDGITKEQFLKSRILYHDGVCFDDGIAYGNSSEEIQYAFDTVKNASAKFKLLIEQHKNTVSNFLLDINNLISGKLIANNTVERIYL